MIRWPKEQIGNFPALGGLITARFTVGLFGILKIECYGLRYFEDGCLMMGVC